MRQGDNDVDPDDFWQAQASPPVGTIGQLDEYPEPRKIRKRPIGFTADIDETFEET